MESINIPAGYVLLEVKVSMKGSIETKIIRDGASSCSDGDDKRLIDGVLNGPISGFGNKLGETIDQGRTGEYWQKVKQNIPQTVTPEENDGGAFFGPRTQEKELDQGYGV